MAQPVIRCFKERGSRCTRPDPPGLATLEGRRETLGSPQPDATASIRTLIRTTSLRCYAKKRLFGARGFSAKMGNVRAGMMDFRRRTPESDVAVAHGSIGGIAEVGAWKTSNSIPT